MFTRIDMTTIIATTKNRTSLCREWERNRRNKFNDAITRLGEVVREVNKSKESCIPSHSEKDKAKCAKIEIVQKAILCLTNCAQEKTQLKAEILALQVKLESTDKHKPSRKDVSTQVHMELVKKNKNGRHVTALTQNSSDRDSKQKPKQKQRNKIQITPMPKLPNILPRCNVFDKKAPDNAIVVLPAAPYVFPQRQVLFPAGPPAIVVFDHNLQTVNKSLPVVSRHSGDITKTTTVNILPISAYSRPLSANKNKKGVKLKSDPVKKTVKKNKLVDGVAKETNVAKSSLKVKSGANKSKENKNPETSTRPAELDEEEIAAGAKAIRSTRISDKNESNKQIYKDSGIDNEKPPGSESGTADTDRPEESHSTKTDEPPPSAELDKFTPAVSTNVVVPVSTDIADKIAITEADVKHKPLEINIPSVDKHKDNKLPNILDTALCDGGNARLELAEEFLAASPTAAFLMSFPLVSGNRADSPAEEPQPPTKDHKRNDLIAQTLTASTAYSDKAGDVDSKTKHNDPPMKSVPLSENKTDARDKLNGVSAIKAMEPKVSVAVAVSVSNENPFLNLPMPSLVSTCTLSDATFGLDFDCTLSKPVPPQPSGYSTNAANNIFYKNDPFSTVKSTIYSTSGISSSHEFNSLGLYPCAVDKYSSKSKPDFPNMDDGSLMKMGSSRLTYDIDLGWSHKGFDFVNCTTNAPTFTKDNILTSAPSAPFSSSYNPFNPEFHVPLVSSATKRDVSNKTTSSFADTISNFYSQPSNLWTEEPFYSNSSAEKTSNARHQHYAAAESAATHSHVKHANVKYYEAKEATAIDRIGVAKSTNHSIGHQLNQKYTKKSPSKMHINWMTSEIRPAQNCSAAHSDIKQPHKLSYNYSDVAGAGAGVGAGANGVKRHDNETSNYFPLSMPNFPPQAVQDDFQVWPSVRPLGTTEVSIDPPPINLPTLVGDLALGPHDRKRTLESASRTTHQPHQDPQNYTSFFSVTQLMNRSNDNSTARYQPPLADTVRSFPAKQNVSHYAEDGGAGRKQTSTRLHAHPPHPPQPPQPYTFGDPKPSHSYEHIAQYSHTNGSKSKPNGKSDKNPKSQKNNYSAEALLRGGNFTQKNPEHGVKYVAHAHKYAPARAAPCAPHEHEHEHELGVAQVSHFPPLLEYSEGGAGGGGGYAHQQFPGAVHNSFYGNFMPAAGNYGGAAGPFVGDYADYAQSAECGYVTHKYEELKMRGDGGAGGDKAGASYKSARRDAPAKHKLECSKREGGKKYHSKRTKCSAEAEEWSEPWQAAGREVFAPPATARANFNLSTIFPEITMKVQ